jgi:hypothetical protein
MIAKWELQPKKQYKFRFRKKRSREILNWESPDKEELHEEKFVEVKVKKKCVKRKDKLISSGNHSKKKRKS